MKKNRIDIEIVGLDFRQDVEPLIKEFFPGFFHESGVRITIDARETSFEIRVEMSGKWSEDSKKSCSEGSYKENRGEENPYEVDHDGANPDGKRSEDSRICLETESFDLSGFGDEKARHREYRNRLLRALYKVLHEFTGKSLPWGILTGVRPTKLLFERIERGEGKPLQFMEEKYFCSREKASLAAQVAAVEYQLLDSIDYRNGYSLYAGIPFCPSICNYCTFGSHPIGKFSELVEPYIEALMKEISAVSGIYHDRVESVGIMDERKKVFFKPRRLETVYIGGGTPTSLTAEQLRRVIRCIKDNFDMGGVVEFSVEAGRPDSITEEKLCMLKEEGITRISINLHIFS